MTQEDVDALKARMRGIVEQDMPFHRYDVHTEEAIKIFNANGSYDKVRLLQTNDEVYSDYYTLGDTPDYYYGRLVPSTGYLKVWDVQLYHDGLLMRACDKSNPFEVAPFVDQPKTYGMFKENLK